MKHAKGGMINMPQILVTLWNNDDKAIMMPLIYTKVGGKYLYGPEANGKKRTKAVPVKISRWQKVKDRLAFLWEE
jgi:hypothetical protein